MSSMDFFIDKSIQVVEGMRGLFNAEGVYFNIDNDKIPISKKLIDEQGDVMFLEMNITNLIPEKPYINLMRSIGIKREDCIAEITGFTEVKRELSQKNSIYPIVEGGAYNPVKKYKSNRSSASRRIKILDAFSDFIELDGVERKINVMNLNLTFPKEISKYFFDLKGKEDTIISKRILKKFMLKVFGKDFGYWDNLHKWGSDDPFNPHYHFHTYGLNYLFNKDKKINKLDRNEKVDIEFLENFGEAKKGDRAKCKLESAEKLKREGLVKITLPKQKTKLTRIKPYFTKQDLKRLQGVWKQTIIEELGKDLVEKLGIESENWNIWFQYFEGYRHFNFEKEKEKIKILEKSEKEKRKLIQLAREEEKKYGRIRCELLHLLKYCTRSYLIDVSKYFSYHAEDKQVQKNIKEDFGYYKKRFKKFVDKGCIQNRTGIHGFLHSLQGIIEEASEELWWSVYKDKENKITRRCPVTGEKEQRDSVTKRDKLDIKENLTVYLGWKSKVIRLGVLKPIITEQELKDKSQRRLDLQ